MVYAFKASALVGILELLTYLKEISTHTLLVTNEKILLAACSENFYIPEDYPEEVTSYITVVFGQLFAYHLAFTKGLGPDTPRGLRKGTKTL